ncbi:hypothetical protein GQ44DRAFT_829048 [Phaeosphaeriaceae sp. PMI808]|nr:hypothetical protein GQ44DRAFT_829048 [Phaeosphaeriaceae sp. PMI808]
MVKSDGRSGRSQLRSEHRLKPARSTDERVREQSKLCNQAESNADKAPQAAIYPMGGNGLAYREPPGCHSKMPKASAPPRSKQAKDDTILAALQQTSDIDDTPQHVEEVDLTSTTGNRFAPLPDENGNLTKSRITTSSMGSSDCISSATRGPVALCPFRQTHPPSQSQGLPVRWIIFSHQHLAKGNMRNGEGIPIPVHDVEELEFRPESISIL